jgi:hypothetical protein
MPPSAFKTQKAIEKELDDTELLSEKVKLVARYLAEAEAYATYYKDTLRDEILATEAKNFGAMLVSEKGTSEAKLSRLARTTDKYKEESTKYLQALELKIFLRTYLVALQMQHDIELARERRTTAEIKSNIYQTGS